MVKNSVNRLLHVVIPFGAMVFLQRALLFALDYTLLAPTIAELLAFVLSTVCAALLFKLVRLEIDGDGEAELNKKGWLPSLLICVASITAMVWLMYAVSIIMGTIHASDTELSILSVISLVLVHPLLEEYVFRGLFYRELRQMSPIFAVLVQAVMFAIVHSDVSGMIYALVAGGVLAVVVELTGRLLPSIIAHMAINIRSLLYLTVLSDRPELTRAADMMLLAIGLLAFAGVHIVLSRGGEKKTEADGSSGMTEGQYEV